MRLYEDTQEEIIARFQAVLDAYKTLKDTCSRFNDACQSEKDLEFDAEYINDFCSEELKKKLDGVKESILDKYYPVATGDDEEDVEVASQRYKDSINQRNQIFKD